MNIGIFDSGVGGLGIFKAITKLLPEENIIYFADEANFPYGEKSTRELQKITEKIVDFLIKQDCKLIIVACNTASVSSLLYLRSKFKIPIVGVVPVVKTASAMSIHKRIGILGTTLTTESNYLKTLVSEFCPEELGFRVYYQDADELVKIVEDNDLINVDQILGRILVHFKKKKVDAIALGCTHFPFLKDRIQKIMGPEVAILDSNEAVARQVQRVLYNNRALEYHEKPYYTFLIDRDKEKFAHQIGHLIGIKNPRVDPVESL